MPATKLLLHHFCLCLEKMLLGLFAWVVKQEFNYFNVSLWPEMEYQPLVLHCLFRQKTIQNISKCLTFSWSSENLSHCVYLVSHDWKKAHASAALLVPGSAFQFILSVALSAGGRDLFKDYRHVKSYRGHSDMTDSLCQAWYKHIMSHNTCLESGTNPICGK